MKKITDITITINGQPLAEYIGKELASEIETIRVEVVSELHKSIHHVHQPKSRHTGTGSGRKAGNPGVKKARVLSATEIEAENIRRGLIPFPKAK